MVHLGNDWDEILAGEFEQDYYKRIRYWLKKEYAEQTIYTAAENIFNALRYTPYSKELQSDLGITPPKDGTLTKWAERGVLMLNTTLTVRRGQANSHKNLGWTTFTDHIIEKLNEHEQPIVFLLWGGNARSKKKLITAPQHLVLASVHPSPLSAYNGFFGCKHFSKCNAFLEAHGIDPIDWDLNH